MAKTLKKRDELVEDVENFELFMRVPAAGSWRRMRLFNFFQDTETREARDGHCYTFWDFVQWYGPTRAEWYWNHVKMSLKREARDGHMYNFHDFVEWYGPFRAGWYWSHDPLLR